MCIFRHIQYTVVTEKVLWWCKNAGNSHFNSTIKKNKPNWSSYQKIPDNEEMSIPILFCQKKLIPRRWFKIMCSFNKRDTIF